MNNDELAERLEKLEERVAAIEQGKFSQPVDQRVTTVRHALISFLENPNMEIEARRTLLTMLR